MQSKYKLTRQIPLTTTYYDKGLVLLNPDQLAFAFHPRSGQGIYANVNSTKGIMMSGEVDKEKGGNLMDSINQLCPDGIHNCILRDMGKTMYSAYRVRNTDIDPPTKKAYFRQVQIITPTSIGANGWNGGPNGSTFGVKGYPNSVLSNDSKNPLKNTTSYFTIYIPVTIANIVAEGSSLTNAIAIAGGQL
jgi:hypothetical protein